MAVYLLDTDAIIDYLNEIPRSKQLIDSLVGRQEILAVCDIILTEVYAGVAPIDEDETDRILGPWLYLQTSREAAKQAGRWRYAFARQGLQLKTYDTLVAATAVENDAIVVTANLRDYPMPGVSLLPLPR